MLSLLLPLLVLVPAIGAVVGALLPGGGDASRYLCRAWAMFISLVTALIALVLAIGFFASSHSNAPAAGGPASLVVIQWGQNDWGIKQVGFSLHLGLDSISLWLLLLTALLMPPAILSSYESVRDRPKQYYAWMLGLHAAMLGCFIARDVLLFYVFFELTLIPMFFIIGIWGGPERRRAAGKFFLFTFAGSVFTLAGVIYLGALAGSFDIIDITRYAQQNLSETVRTIILLSMLAGFAVKVPLFPVHTWLPLAHTEAPTAGSVILAGVLLKLGTYGLLRFALPLGLIHPATPGGGALIGAAAISTAGLTAIHVMAVICIIGIIYGALCAWVQQDAKKLVAYSSVSHLGFCVLGLVALNDIGMQGSVLYMINHGISTGALFLCVGMFYDRLHTRDITQISGLAKVMPKLAFFMVLFALSSIGLPGTNGFVSEFLTILGAYTSGVLGPWYGSFAALGVILGAVYMLHMLACVIFGPLKLPGQGHYADDAGHEHGAGAHGVGASMDLTDREVGLLVPLAIAVFVIGFAPTGILDSLRAPIDQIRAPLVSETVPVAAGKVSSPQQSSGIVPGGVVAFSLAEPAHLAR
jgi:NADH-quinone oxidoreductase subunit M